MGCGSSANQVHDINAPPKGQIETSSRIVIDSEEKGPFAFATSYLFGQTSGERKVVQYNSEKQFFKTLSSRIRIPTPKIKLEVIEVLYEQSQQIILPEIFNQSPKPPFNSMVGTFIKKDVIFLCGGIVYENDYVSDQSFFYSWQPKMQEKRQKMQVNMKKRFQPTTKMNYARYGHMGVYKAEKSDGLVYVFGGRNDHHQCISSCQKFSINQKRWTEIASMKTNRAEGFAMTFLSRIYVFGGISNFKEYPQSIQVYHPSTDSWDLLNIKIHRGIRSALILSDQPNQILILGGVSYEQPLKSIIRVNLVDENYEWQADLNQKMFSIKSAQSKDRIVLFGGTFDNQMLEYHYQHKAWRLLNYGFKNNIPVNDIQKFTCVSQPLHIGFAEQKYNKKQQLDGYTFGKNTTLMLGNQNYPTIFTIKFDEPDNIVICNHRVPMQIRLASFSNLVLTKAGYLITGGVGQRFKNSKFSTFMLDIHTFQAIQLDPMGTARFRFGICELQNRVYVFGGYREINFVLKDCEMYDMETKTWQPIGDMQRGRSNVLSHYCAELNKIILIGGRQLVRPCPLIEIFDPIKHNVCFRQEFEDILGSQDIIQIFCQQLTPQQVKESVKTKEYSPKRKEQGNIIRVKPTNTKIEQKKGEKNEQSMDEIVVIMQQKNEQNKKLVQSKEGQDNFDEFVEEKQLPISSDKKRKQSDCEKMHDGDEPVIIQYEQEKDNRSQRQCEIGKNQEIVGLDKYTGIRLYIYKREVVKQGIYPKFINKIQVGVLYIHKETLQMRLHVHQQNDLDRQIMYTNHFQYQGRHYFMSNSGGFRVDPQSQFSTKRIKIRREDSHSDSEDILSKYREMESFSTPSLI